MVNYAYYELPTNNETKFGPRSSRPNNPPTHPPTLSLTGTSETQLAAAAAAAVDERRVKKNMQKTAPGEGHTRDYSRTTEADTTKKRELRLITGRGMYVCTYVRTYNVRTTHVRTTYVQRTYTYVRTAQKHAKRTEHIRRGVNFPADFLDTRRGVIHTHENCGFGEIPSRCFP